MTKLAELIAIKHGFAFAGEYFQDAPTDYVLLTPGNFRIGGGYKGDKLKFYNGPIPEEYILKPGDLIVTMTDLSKNMDALGCPARVPKLADNRVALHNQRLGLVTVTSPIVDAGWLYWVMCSGPYRNEVLASSTGTTVHHTSPSRILAFDVDVPPLGVQQAIAATLGVLDDKIESNRRLIEIVPDLIRNWISELLEVSKNEISASELASFVNGGAYTKGASGSGRLVIRIAELNSGLGGSTVYNDLDVGENQLARPGDILMSWSGSLGLYRWFRDEAIINQHIFKVISRGYPDWLVFDRLRSVMEIFRGIAKDKATTMGHIQRGHLDSTKVTIPSEENIRALDQRLAPLWAKLLLAERENLKLAAFRDTILPELLSGRIRVPKAERAIL